MWSLCKKEFRQFFSNLTGYLAIGLFLLLNGLLLFVFSSFNILEYGYASLDNYFTLSPYVLLILIPAITMRQISDEWRNGTMELLRTRPLTHVQIIAGKYLAAFLVTCMALLPTITYAITIKNLAAGDAVLDTGAWIGSYTGLLFLSAVFCAISLFAGSFTQNPVVALLSGITLCFLLFKGMGTISRLPLFENRADFYLQQLGLEYHYQSISRGVLDLRDLFYFLSCIFLFLFFSVKRISANQSPL
jgi:ABC-2 type transport system permease protein